MSADELNVVMRALADGIDPPFATVREMRAPDATINLALESTDGRRWLRSLTDLDTELADRLLVYESDFKMPRRDRTLDLAVAAASAPAIREHVAAIASGAAAAALWRRLAGDPDQLVDLAVGIVSGHRSAAESTLYLLILDPFDPYALGNARRAAIARAALSAAEAATRSLAAEYLFDNGLDILAQSVEQLVLDSDERVRGLAWSAGFRTYLRETYDLAIAVLGDESQNIPIRRSALAAIGTHFQTNDVVDILSVFVAHPDETLALDAGNLLYRLHRHPTIATAAANSPHANVREIGEFLLDPYRGSPAAGGSRPGDPTSSDIFAEMIRQTEAREPDEPR